MNKLWDKFLLGLSCCAFMLAEGTDPSNITTLLLAVICSAIFQIKPSSAVAYLSVIAYSSLCIFSKEALILAPLVLYDAFCTKFYPAMVLTFIGVLANIFTLGKDIFPLVALFLVSFTISSRSVLNEKLTKMLINTRDNSKELTTQLVEKNKAMQRNQDYEIYLATLKERNRIAREIHDNVGHMLTRSILQLGALSVINKDETVGEAINDLSGIEAGEKILAGYPDARILYLTTFSDDEYIIKAVLMGAKEYILKQDFESICPALETVMNGQTVFGSDVASKLPELLTNHSSFDFDHYGIVEKEQEIIEQVAKGLSNKEIASLLYLSEGTVRNYISTILEKLSLRDRTQLAIFYYTNIQ